MEDNKEEGERAPVGNIKYIQVSAGIYIKMLTNDVFMDLIMNPLPKDAKFVRGGIDNLGSIFLVVESKEWPLLKEGDEIPYYGPMIFKRARTTSQKEIN